MAKGKRKSNRKPVDKRLYAQAQQAKRLGLISKQAKTTGGKLSRGVIKKTETLKSQGLVSNFLITSQGKAVRYAPPQNVAVKAPKKLVNEAKAREYETVGNRIVVPADEKNRVTRQVRQGKLAGVQRVPNGQFEIIPLFPAGIKNLDELNRKLMNGDLDRLKAPDELFNFRLNGAPSRQSAGFSSGIELAFYLQRYKIIEDEDEDDFAAKFSDLELVRYSPSYSWRQEREIFVDNYPYKRDRKSRKRRKPKMDTETRARNRGEKTPAEKRQMVKIRVQRFRANRTPEQIEEQRRKDRERKAKQRNR